MNNYNKKFDETESSHSPRATAEDAFVQMMPVIQDRLESGAEETQERIMANIMMDKIQDKYDFQEFEEAFSYKPTKANKTGFKINGYGLMNDGDTLVLFVARFYEDEAPTQINDNDRKQLAESIMAYARYISSEKYKELPEGGSDRGIAEDISRLYKECNDVRFMTLFNRTTTKHYITSKRIDNGKTWAIQFWGLQQYCDLITNAPTPQTIEMNISDYLPEGEYLEFAKDKNISKKDGVEAYSLFMPAKVIRQEVAMFLSYLCNKIQK